MKTPGERIREGRGKRSQTWLGERVAEEMGRKAPYAQTAVSKWEKNKKGRPKGELARAVEKVLGMDNLSLESSDVDPLAGKMPLMGYVQEQTITLFPADKTLKYVDKPAGVPNHARAALVLDESMLPVYLQGNILVWWSFIVDPTPYIGMRCACELITGEVLIKVPYKAVGGGFDLHALSGSRNPIRNAQLAGAAPIKMVLWQEDWRS